MYKENVLQLEDSLCKYHGRSSVLLTGGGTSAIYLALKGLGVKNQWVALPNNVCVNVVLPILYSGNRPYYLDIEEETLGLDPDALRGCPVKLGAVLAPHMYGSVCQIDVLKEICSNLSVPLIEDFAQAQGATYRGKPVGSWGDISVGSFGSGKMIDVDHGGCLFTDNSDWMASIRSFNDSLPNYTPDMTMKIDALGSLLNKLYNRYFSTNPNAISAQFVPEALRIKSSFLFQFEPTKAGEIQDSLDHLADSLIRREQKFQRVRDAFSDVTGVEVFLPPEGSVYWRANLFFSNNRDHILQALLSEKLRVSSWFPSVSVFFAANSSFVTPVSDLVGKTILNLWVNEQIDDEYIEVMKEKILSNM